MANLSDPLFREYEPLANKTLLEKPDIIIYGCGNIANVCIPVFKSLGLNIKTILDKNPALAGTQRQEIPVIHPDDCKDTQSIIVICVLAYFRDIETELKARGFCNILPFFFYLFNRPADLFTDARVLKAYYSMKWRFSKPDFGALDSVDVPITERCSLKCKDCSNLMQYFAKPKHADFAQLVGATKRLLAALEHCHEVRVLGGEPFVNPEWPDYIKALEECSDKYDWIIIFTNATIFPSEKSLENLPVNKLFVEISDYGNPRQKIDEFEALFNKHRIPSAVRKINLWQNCGILQKYNRSPKENLSILDECCVKNTPAIIDGKFFRCPYAASAWQLKAVPESHFRYVDLQNPELSSSDIKQQVHSIMNANDARVCDWCGGRPVTGSYIKPALQADKPLEYEMYE